MWIEVPAEVLDSRAMTGGELPSEDLKDALSSNPPHLKLPLIKGFEPIGPNEPSAWGHYTPCLMIIHPEKVHMDREDHVEGRVDRKPM